MATRALKASWCRKWIVDLRLRPEEYGALLEARRINSTPKPLAAAELHNDVLSSAVLPKILAKYGTPDQKRRFLQPLLDKALPHPLDRAQLLAAPEERDAA